MRWVASALLGVALVATSAPARADRAVTVGDVTVELRDAADHGEPQRVVGLDADGAERWVIEHREWTFEFVEPIVVDGRLLYTRYGDLLELDVERGRIVNRWRFPGRITKLAPGDEPTVVRVTVLDDAAWTDAETTLRYRLGDPAPGRSPWGILVAVKNFAEGAAWTPGARRTYTPGEISDRLAAAQEAELRDPTNPHLAFAVGRWLQLADRPDDARAAFMRAATSQRAPWSDFFHLAAWLQPHDAAAARAAFDNGYRRMLDAGVRPERMQSLISNNVLFLREAADNMRAALAAEDAELAHELATRRWKVMPKIEHGPEFWGVLAAWFEDRGRADLAAVWRERAAAAEDGWLNRAGRDFADTVELIAPLVAGMLFGIVFAAFLAGVRLRREGGWRVPAAAVATVAIPLVLAMGFASTPAAWSWAGQATLFPDDSFGAPSVADELATRPASPERDEVLAWARAESAATLAGGRGDAPMPDDATIAEAIMPAPSWWESLQYADESIGFVTPDWDSMSPGYIDHWLEYLALLLVPLLFGMLLSRFAAPAARWIPRIVPGGARSFSIAGGALFGLFAASLLVVIDQYSTYWARGMGGARLLGFDTIWRDVSAGPSLWWYLPLVAIPLAQALLVWRELRRR